MHIIHLNATSSLPFLYSSSLSLSLLVSFLLIVHRFLHLLAHARERERNKRRDAFLTRERERERKEQCQIAMGSSVDESKKKENLMKNCLTKSIYFYPQKWFIQPLMPTRNLITCRVLNTYHIRPHWFIQISYSYSFDPIASKQNRPRRREKDGWKVNESQS